MIDKNSFYISRKDQIYSKNEILEKIFVLDLGFDII